VIYNEERQKPVVVYDTTRHDCNSGVKVIRRITTVQGHLRQSQSSSWDILLPYLSFLTDLSFYRGLINSNILNLLQLFSITKAFGLLIGGWFRLRIVMIKKRLLKWIYWKLINFFTGLLLIFCLFCEPFIYFIHLIYYTTTNIIH
jgi:hypothetical protein